MRGFLNAIGFLTIFPLPGRYGYQSNFSPALSYFPLTGLLLGIIISLIFWISSLLLPALVAAALAVVAEALLTGGLHYDGLADVFDGIFSRVKKPEGIMAIMKKSDIGTFGVMSVVLVLLLKVSLIYYLYMHHSHNVFSFIAVLAFSFCWGRWSMVYVVAKYPPASRQGLAARFYSPVNKTRFIIATSYALIGYVVVVLAAQAGGPGLMSASISAVLLIGIKAIIAFLVSFLAAAAFSQFLSKKLGGINGDAAGAVSQVMEVTFLLWSLMMVF